MRLVFLAFDLDFLREPPKSFAPEHPHPRAISTCWGDYLLLVVFLDFLAFLVAFLDFLLPPFLGRAAAA